MSYKNLFTTVLLAVVLAGCAKNGQQAARDNAAAFEQVKEPAINSNTYFAAGQLAEGRQEFDKAEAQYKKALKENPRHEAALYRLGCLYADQQKFPQALDAWRQYVKVTHGSAEAYSNLGFCQELAGNPAAAEAEYRHGIAKDPKNEACRVNYGLMLARHGRINEGILQLQAVLTPPEVHYNLAGIYELQHRRELAKLEYQHALELDPTFAEARLKLAQLD